MERNAPSLEKAVSDSKGQRGTTVTGPLLIRPLNKVKGQKENVSQGWAQCRELKWGPAWGLGWPSPLGGGGRQLGPRQGLEEEPAAVTQGWGSG